MRTDKLTDIYASRHDSLTLVRHTDVQYGTFASHQCHSSLSTVCPGQADSQIKHTTDSQWCKVRTLDLFRLDPCAFIQWGALSAYCCPRYCILNVTWHWSKWIMAGISESLQRPWETTVQTGPGRESRLRGYERFPVRTPTFGPWTTVVPILHQHVSRDSHSSHANVWLLPLNDAKTLNICICFAFITSCGVWTAWIVHISI